VKFKFVIPFLILICVCFASAADNEWAFDTMDKLLQWTSDSDMLQFDIKNGKCEFIPMGNKPYISRSFGKTDMDVADYKYAAVRVSCDSAGCTLRFIIETTEAEYQSELPIGSGGEWENVVFNTELKGTLNKITLYFLRSDGVHGDAHIVIDRIGLFETEEKTQQFLGRSLISLKENEKLFSPDGINPPSWVFSGIADTSVWNISGETFNKVGMLNIKADGTIKAEHLLSHSFNALEFAYFAFRYKTSTEFSQTYLSFNGMDSPKSHFVLQSDGAWHNVIVDMSKYSHRAWKDRIHQLALIFDGGGEIDIERVGFFSNYYDASAFLLQSASFDNFSDGAVYKGSNYKITVLPDKMSEPYTEHDIMPSGVADIKSGTCTDVVLCDGTPLSLSEVTKNGYVVYFASKKGLYTIKQNKKQYIDTDSHWGSEYIDYVSARTLFGGTSETEFSPDMTITRGMLITVLGRMHGVDASLVGNDSGYADVAPEQYYAPYIKWGRENGIFNPDGMFFCPESPITRGEMSLVISNYVSYSGYTFPKRSADFSFNDIDHCSEQIKNAIIFVQSLGIIKGKALYIFDPDGFFTRAEACTVMTRLIKSILGLYHDTYYTDEYFAGEKLHIGALGNFDTEVLNENLLEAYGTAGFNTLLMSNEMLQSEKINMTFDYCDRNGINVITTQQSPYDSNLLEYSERPSFYGSLLANEIGSEDLTETSILLEEYHSYVQGKKSFINLLPLYSSGNQLKYGTMADFPDYYDADLALYSEYCREYAQLGHTDVLMTSIFPYTENGLYESYIEAVSIVSSIARENGKELWCIVQTDSGITEKNMVLRQYYTLLSFGCHNFICWLWTEGICDANSNITPTYYAVQSANKELNAISDVLMEYEYASTVVYNAEKTYDNKYFTNISLSHPYISDLISDRTIVVGVFDGENGKERAYSLVNSSESDAAQVKIKLSAETITAYLDGVAQQLTCDSDGYFCFTLGAGQGVFITE